MTKMIGNVHFYNIELKYQKIKINKWRKTKIKKTSLNGQDVKLFYGFKLSRI